MIKRIMMIRAIKSSLFIGLILIAGKLYSQIEPNWTVNPYAYQYSMTAVAVASVDCNELFNNANMIGAFVNGECRGVAKTDNLIGGRNMAYIIIYGNNLSGDTVLLKYYDASTGLEYNSIIEFPFSNNSSNGTSDNPIVVMNNHIPNDIILTESELFSNAANDSIALFLSSIDTDDTDNHVYELVSGEGSDNNDLFRVSFDTLIHAQALPSGLDSVKIRLRTTDNNTCYFEKQFKLPVTKVKPSAINLSDSVFNENEMFPQIGTFSVVDNEIPGEYTYTLVTGLGDFDNDFFKIDNAKLLYNGSANFEDGELYSIRCQVSGADNFILEQAFNIYVNDVNDVPTDILLSNTAVFENMASDQFVAKISTIDEDVADIFTYTFANIGTNQNSSFKISNDSLFASKVFDFELVNTYVVYLTTYDGLGTSVSKSFMINIKDTLDAPTDILIEPSEVEENSALSTFVGKLSSVDNNLPGPNTYLYSFVNGNNDNDLFALSNDSIFTAAIFDYEAENKYEIKVRSEMVNGMYFDKVLPINIVDAPDTIQDVTLSVDSILENNKIPYAVCTLNAISQDSAGVFTYSLVNGEGDADNTLFSITDNELKLHEQSNFEIKNTYSIRIRAINLLNQGFEKAFKIKILDDNDTPTDINLSDNEVFENTNADTLIGTFSTIDEDVDNTFSYTFDNSVLNDNESFNLLTSGDLLVKSALDYESKSEYLLSITSTDQDGASIIKQFTIYVKDTLDKPTDIMITNSLVAENKPALTYIGSFITVDINQPGPVDYVYSFVPGDNDNDVFQIFNDSLFTDTTFNYEMQKTYKVEIRTELVNGMYLEKTAFISITDQVDLIEDIELSNNTFSENNNGLVNVGAFSCISQDSIAENTYALVSGEGDTDNVFFNVTGSELRYIDTADYEAQNQFKIRVQATDALNRSFEKAFVIFVSDANDHPTNILLDSNLIAENLSVSTSIGYFTTIDQDTSDIYTYEFDNSVVNNNSYFNLLSGGQLLSNQSFNYESTDSLLINVRATDAFGISIVKQFIIYINDVNEAPTEIKADSLFLNENEPIGTNCGVLSSTDPDKEDKVSYALVEGIGDDDNVSFYIEGNHLVANAVFDYESKNEYNVRVRGTDLGGLYFEKEFKVVVKNNIDTIQNILLSNNTLNENNSQAVKVGSLSCASQDSIAKYTFALIAGNGDNNNSSFNVNGLELSFTDTADFEVINNYKIRIQATDELGRSFEKEFTINVADINDAPTNVILNNSSINENLPASSKVGQLSAIDQDSIDTHKFEFDNTVVNNNNAFNLLLTGELLSNEVFNYENTDSLLISVRVTDKEGVSFIKQFTIQINDVNEAPQNTLSDSLFINENMPVGTQCGVFRTTDPDINDEITYSLVEGNGADDNLSFYINGNKLYSEELFDYEQKSNYKIRLRTSDSQGLYIENELTVEIKNVNDIPSQINLSELNINENNAPMAVVGYLSTLDQDQDEIFSYTFVSGSGADDNNDFSIDGDALKIKVESDYEQKSSYSVLIKSVDSYGGEITGNFKIAIHNVNEKPLLEEQTFEVLENEQVGYEIATIEFTDDDNGQAYMFELLNTNVPFELDQASGIITLSSEIDYETLDNYEMQVTITDNGSPELADTALIIVQVVDVIESEEPLPSADFVSPNNDGKNDYWKITNVDMYENYSLVILDERGQVVYQISGGYNNDWDAYKNGKPLPNGTYYYSFSDNNSNNSYQGFITVVK